ncbi:MAG: hypothetical protein QW203_02685 [Thermoplasmatales archaeon]
MSCNRIASFISLTIPFPSTLILKIMLTWMSMAVSMTVLCAERINILSKRKVRRLGKKFDDRGT